MSKVKLRYDIENRGMPTGYLYYFDDRYYTEEEYKKKIRREKIENLYSDDL